MKKLILFLSIICASGLTMVNIYNGVIDAQSWVSDIPASIQTARDYFQHVDPRRFYTIVGPVNEILILLTIVFLEGCGLAHLLCDFVPDVHCDRRPHGRLLPSPQSNPLYLVHSGSP
jgi:hypothetical protein